MTTRTTKQPTRRDVAAINAALRAAGLVIIEGRGYTRDRTPAMVLPGRPLSDLIVEGRG